MTIRKDPNNKQVLLKFEKMSDTIFYDVEKAFYEIGKLLRDDLRKGLRRGKRTGLKYKNRPFSASRKGEYPQRVTGNLREAVSFKVKSYKELWFGILNKAPYAVFLEKKGRKLVDYTVEKLNKNAQNILRTRLNHSIKRDK